MTEKSSAAEDAELTGRKQDVKENLARIRAEIEKAREARGGGEAVTLLAATKTVPAELINYATQECGLSDIGENRVQELLDKYDALEKKGVTIHFIGSLQKNKVKYICDKVDMIHSVDSLPLAEEIEKRCAAIGKTMKVLIEVNIGREKNKGGVFPEDAEALADEIGKLPHLSLSGIMTIAPAGVTKEEYLKFFKETSQIYLDICAKKIHNRDRTFLSMGMSDTYSEAIVCGSNLVRIGTAIFGKRSYPDKV